jgi:hypothetical protein
MLLSIGLFIVVGCSNGGDTIETSPAITLDPPTGGAGTTVSVAGFDFPAGTPVSLRLGPPDVGATPQSYAQATAGSDGRFSLTFIIPDQWPDGRPITEAELTVIVLNEDGSLRATAPFAFHPGQIISPSTATTGGVETPNSTLVQNEEAVVAAINVYLTETGANTQVAVSVEQIEGEFARVTVHSLDPQSPEVLYGFLKWIDTQWVVLVAGSDLDPEQLLELGIPPTILPEEWLIPEG